MILLFTFWLVLSLDSQNCLNVFCDTVITPHCVLVQDDGVHISPCPPTQYCPNLAQFSISSAYQNQICVDIPEPASNCSINWGKGKNPAGWVCCTNSDCLSGSCVSNICMGKSKNEKCLNGGECVAGLCCSSNCVDCLPDSSSCSADEECLTGSGCNNKVCTQLFSLNIGQAASDPKYCISNYVYNGKCDALKIYNQDQKTSTKSLIDTDYKCNIGDTCLYILSYSNTQVTSSSCLCTGSPGSTSGYCPILSGVGGADFTFRFRYSSSNCSGLLAHTGDPYYISMCGAMKYADYELYQNITVQRKYWGLYRTNSVDGCSLDLGLYNPKNYFNMSYKKILAFGMTVFILI